MKARGSGNKTEHSRRGPEANFPNRYYSLIFLLLFLYNLRHAKADVYEKTLFYRQKLVRLD